MGNNTKIPECIWQAASERILNMTYRRLGKLGTIQYFIVGNDVDGYCGIERDLSREIKMDEWERPIWKYIVMDSRESRRIIKERIAGSMKL